MKLDAIRKVLRLVDSADFERLDHVDENAFAHPFYAPDENDGLTYKDIREAREELAALDKMAEAKGKPV